MSFDERWKRLARAAREAERPLPPVPVDLARRAWAAPPAPLRLREWALPALALAALWAVAVPLAWPALDPGEVALPAASLPHPPLPSLPPVPSPRRVALAISEEMQP